uniref:Uncharacterized protein n=1 Tax=Panagrolaimus superbus TaxID=310955 RepID=A0A914Y2V5_9BILA
MVYQYFVNNPQQPSIDKEEELQICDECDQLFCNSYDYMITFEDESSTTIKSITKLKTKKPCLPVVAKAVEKSDKKDGIKCPVITFYDNLSFISVYNEDSGEYEALEEWNGDEGAQLFISFDEEKPKYCDEAAEVYDIKPSFVVYDLVKIMSIPPKNLKAERSHWCFRITKDDKNPVLIEFDNFDGTKKAASPEFLMALLLKQHLKVITAKLGTKQKHLSYAFPDLTDKEYNRVIGSLHKASKLINVKVVPFSRKKCLL